MSDDIKVGNWPFYCIFSNYSFPAKIVRILRRVYSKRQIYLSFTINPPAVLRQAVGDFFFICSTANVTVQPAPTLRRAYALIRGLRRSFAHFQALCSSEQRCSPLINYFIAALDISIRLCYKKTRNLQKWQGSLKM